MTNTNALDSILPGSGPALTYDSEIISLASRIAAGEHGVLVELHRTDVMSGHSVTELVRLNADGGRSASLVLHPDLDPAEQRIAAALAENAAAGLALVPGGAVPLHRDLVPVATALGALAPSIDSRIALSEDWCAVFDPAQAALHLLNRADPSVSKAPDLAELQLDGWRSLTGINMAGDAVFAAVADPVAGFDLYRCDPAAGSPAFERILTRGAQRFALNGAVASMACCDGGLLVGTAALAGPADPVGNWGPELLLVSRHATWDLIAGQPRFSPEGLMLPASTQMPGMGLPENAAVNAIAHRDGRTVIAMQGYAGATVEDRREAVANLFDYRGAVRLYRSSDLTDWEEVAHDLPDDLGAVTSLCLTGDGVFLGHEGLGTDIVPVRFVELS